MGDILFTIAAKSLEKRLEAKETDRGVWDVVAFDGNNMVRTMLVLYMPL